MLIQIGFCKREFWYFVIVLPSQSGSVLGPKLINMLTELGIEKKIFLITLDDACYNEDIVERLIDHFTLMDSLLSDGKYAHIRCSNHILNWLLRQVGRQLKLRYVTLGKASDILKVQRQEK